jgi:iron complex outermembrane receptor protein
MTLSATAYHALYDHLTLLTATPSLTQAYFVNGMTGWTTGFESWATYQFLPWWRGSAGFTALRQHQWVSDGLFDVEGLAQASGQNPERSWQLRSAMDLPGQTELDVAERRVSALSDPAVPGYYSLDTILGWHPISRCTLQFAVLNLLDRAHGEFTDIAYRMQVGRSVVLKATVAFK